MLKGKAHPSEAIIRDNPTLCSHTASAAESCTSKPTTLLSDPRPGSTEQEWSQEAKQAGNTNRRRAQEDADEEEIYLRQGGCC